MLSLKTSTAMELLPVVCLCLLTRCGITSADGNESVVVTVEQDRDVILPCSLSTKENIEQGYFYWYKLAQSDEKQKDVFQYEKGKHTPSFGSQDDGFKGRVSHFPEELKHGNASITIRNTKMADNGTYTCVFPERQTFPIELVVGAAPKPYVTILDEAKDWSRLQCEVHGTPDPKLEWQDSAGNKLTAEEPQVSKREGRLYFTLNTTVTKTDRYRCVATQETISHQTEAEIYVHISGAATEPSIKTLNQTNNWALLQCVVRGASPKPKVEWKDSSGNKLPAEEPQVTDRGGSYDIILQTTVTKTDYYHCVVTQEEINHHISAETYVHISVSEPPTGWIVAVVLLGAILLFVLLGLAVLVYKGCIPLNCNKDSPANRKDGSEDALNG